MRNTWEGTIGHVGRKTDDGRVIDSIFFDLHRGICPLIHGRDIVGTVDVVGVTAESEILARGRTTLDSGEYIVWLSADGILTHEAEDGTSVITEGRFVALTVDTKAAWPDTKITVKEGP